MFELTHNQYVETRAAQIKKVFLIIFSFLTGQNSGKFPYNQYSNVASGLSEQTSILMVFHLYGSRLSRQGQ